MTPTERDDLNKRIAEDLEPMPEVPTDLMNRSICGTKYWHFVYGVNEWRANDIITDPALTLLLMEKGNLSVSPAWTGYMPYQRNGWQSGPMNETGHVLAYIAHGLTIGEAVVLAYAKMRGLK